MFIYFISTSILQILIQPSKFVIDQLDELSKSLDQTTEKYSFWLFAKLKGTGVIIYYFPAFQTFREKYISFENALELNRNSN